MAILVVVVLLLAGPLRSLGRDAAPWCALGDAANQFFMLTKIEEDREIVRDEVLAALDVASSVNIVLRWPSGSYVRRA
jgi:hypothetical protein